jgi:formate dehydrogenase subunit delta
MRQSIAQRASREVGVVGVASHISRFWEPRMRRELLAYVERGGGPDLSPIVAAAARRLEPVPETP